MSGFRAIVMADEPGPARLRAVRPGAGAPARRRDGRGDALVAQLQGRHGRRPRTGNVIRRYPMVCGVDLAGVVERSESERWHPGDAVIATGWGLGEVHPGGFTERQRLRAEWLTRCPEAFTASQTMALGTAGLTAMLCPGARARARGGSPERGGGRRGARHRRCRRRRQHRRGVAREPRIPRRRGDGPPCPPTPICSPAGRAHARSRARSSPGTPRALGHERWAGAIDPVGGETLANVLSQLRYGGAVAACGLAGGSELPTSVFPFILRGVSLLGVDSVMCPAPARAIRRGSGWDATCCSRRWRARPAWPAPLARVLQLAGEDHRRPGARTLS